jgi:hypothetical protein
MCMIDDADTWTVFRDEVRRAAKAHCCTECGRTIEKGETYEFATGMMDGTWWPFKTCEHCLAARRWLTVLCHGFLYEQVFEELHQHWVDEYQLRSRWLALTVIHMRKGWKRSDGSLYPVSAPRRGVDYPVFIKPSSFVTFYNGEPNPEYMEKEIAKISLAIIASLWWGNWFLVENARQFGFTLKKYAQQIEAAA